VAAHNELGVCELKQQQPAAAAREFQTAAILDPGAVTPALNLSLSLYLLKRFSDAEIAARHALKLNPALSKARYLLGMSLHSENHFSKEMLEDLRRVADEFPDARIAMADALAKLGRKTEAAQQLEQYLFQSGGATERHAVEVWLANLQR
jgi:tetratricopeptide (TPR) repeat protein